MSRPKPKREKREHESPARSRNLRLTDEVWADLETIAKHHGLDWGGIPNRTEAIKLLVRMEIERIGG